MDNLYDCDTDADSHADAVEREAPVVMYLSLFVALIGVLMYALLGNAKLAEIGRLAYFAGLLAFLLQVSHTVTVVK